MTDKDSKKKSETPVAVILAAGVSRRLFPHTATVPKCLVKVGHQTILDWQLSALKTVGVTKVCMVVGYRRDAIVAHAKQHHPEITFTFIVNHFFYETNTCYSLWLAARYFINRDFYYLNGDVLFEPVLLERLAVCQTHSGLAVESKNCGQEEVKVVLDGDGYIVEIGKTLSPMCCEGEFVGVARFSASMTNSLVSALACLVQNNRKNDYFESALEPLASAFKLVAVDATDLPVIEIDFPSDLETARTQVISRFYKDTPFRKAY